VDAAEPTVTALGEAVASARPDEGIWTIELSAVQATPDDALQEINGRTGELERLLDELSIPAEQRSTMGVSVREEFDHDRDGKRIHRGYRASNVLTVRLSDPAESGRLIGGAIERAEASVNGPDWIVAADNPARIEAGERAAVAARRKAEAYAEALGLGLGAVREIRDATASRGPVARAFAAADVATMHVDPGEIQVAAAVEVTFALES
jgi:uncharacterized protein